jgi:uncharacterized HhH-GPD family protein
VATHTQPDRLHFTGDEEADRLLASDPFALLIGFALDQQVPLPRAFSAPLELKRRIGTLDPGRIAALDPAELQRAFRDKPALHRFPGAMAERTQALAELVVERYGGDASRLWDEAGDGDELRKRIASLPGFGQMKINALGSVLAKRFRVAAAEPLVPSYPTVGDVDSPEALEAYQEKKRAYKAKMRAAERA